MQCQAKAKSTGEQCKRRAVSGKRVCTVHGGLTPSGVASPNFKHGRYSRHLPSRLTSRYQESLTDENLLELREEIALTDARLSDLLARVDTGEAGRKWQRLRELKAKAATAPNKTKRQAYYAEIFALIDDESDYAAWDEVNRLIAQRRRLAESERKRIMDAQQYLTAQQAMTLIAAMLSIIKEHVSDRDTLRAISRGVDALITEDAGS